jgi:hypothetical protein
LRIRVRSVGVSFGELLGESRDQSRDNGDVSQTCRQRHVDCRNAKERGEGGDSGSPEREREIIRTPMQICRPEGGGWREREKERETERARARQASPPPPPRNLRALMPIAQQVTIEVTGPITGRAPSSSPPPPPRNLRSLMPVPCIVRQGTV